MLQRQSTELYLILKGPKDPHKKPKKTVIWAKIENSSCSKLE